MTPLLVDVATELLNFKVIEALMHEEIDTDDFVELIDSQATDRLEDAEENRAEDRRPGHDD